MHLLPESLVGQCECTTQAKGSISYHVTETKGAVLLLFINEFVLVLYLSFSCLLKLKLLQNLKNEATWV